MVEDSEEKYDKIRAIKESVCPSCREEKSLCKTRQDIERGNFSEIAGNRIIGYVCLDHGCLLY